jgi:3-keto-disaccharide hydrolase
MKYFKMFFLTAIIFCSIILGSVAQNPASSAQSLFVFSAIKGTVSKPDSLMFSATAQSVKWIGADSASFKILFNENQKLVFAFAPPAEFIGIARAKIQIRNSSGKIVTEINLTGLSTNGLEGENEPPLSQIVDVLGYKINVGWTSLANNCLPFLQGDEIPYSLFRKAGNGKVKMIPVARYSPDFELPFGYYMIREHMPVSRQVGILSKAGDYPEHQVLFPAITPGSSSFDPRNESFGFYFTSPSHSAWSEDVWNMLFYPDHAVHATRIYPLKDKNDQQVANTYLVCFEEAKNGDYNDYVFLVKNIAPVTENPFTVLFNGRNLDGWHTFLRDIGTNKDPDNNFMIEDSVLHVLGKDLGYAMTDEGYNNFHFKVDFKWGEKKWPPREDAKRDAGVCYNIPVNEPDSIWPQSIECQIQEGDVGDFWLLGFSTIMQGGDQNIPSAHTRMIKQRDAEKPNGEWNTVEIISYNGRCVQIVNGVVVNAGDNASVRGGRILLQSEYSEIYYRNVKIRKL